MLTLEKIYKASEVLKEVAGKTDILPASKIFCDNHIFLKTENIQSTGSFKVRGAYFKISELTEEEKKRGVIACSAGNHAQGVALAATKHGVKSLICARGRSHKQNSGDKGLRRGRVSCQGRFTTTLIRRLSN